MSNININQFSEETRYVFICPDCHSATDVIEEPEEDSYVVCESCGAGFTVTEDDE